MKKSLPNKWNDWLALLMLVGGPVLWVWGSLDDTVLGATIVAFTLVTQFYFRRSPPGDEGGQ